MKRFLLAAILLPSAIFAQQPPGVNVPRAIFSGPQMPSVALPDNYQVTLTITDKNDPPLEVSVVVASSQFTATLGEQHLNFNGSVTVEESGAVVIAYSLGWQTPAPAGNGNIQFQSSTAQGSVSSQARGRGSDYPRRHTHGTAFHQEVGCVETQMTATLQAA
jgi:hypothetical protein